ncbi:CdaR family transcriptional regulator [Levilactobacillus yiduensis]|uniref:CdaR family transcriptional regulator n=1 Tax=Levilactobacillus yiduensis TaxID=2953880 RepID=UPI000EF308E2|nr:sugar diacid recognition domain-containing protein [Levilactobacillus yiduensis]AYM01699.1 sugar diacid utilization regulator [Levilactobacillus brevis]
MKIDPVLAQSIVNKMMAQIPYNVNLMDQNGYVIASGDSSRINTLHVGALDAIEQKKTLPMARSFGQHGQPGINMPIFFDNEIVGVIGITGDPDKVTPLASLLRIATELLLSQNESNLKEKKRENTLNRFLYQWSQVTSDIESKTELLLEASQLKIDILKPRTAIAIERQNLPIGIMDGTDYKIILDTKTTIILTRLNATIDRLIKYCRAKRIRLGIGLATRNIGKSIQQATQALQISTIFNRSDLIYYQQVAFVDRLLNSELSFTNLERLFEKEHKSESGNELIETLSAFIHNNGSMVHTAAALHIHRNTLSYRLERIKQSFNLDPHKTVELFELYLGYLYFKKQLYQDNSKPVATANS